MTVRRVIVLGLALAFLGVAPLGVADTTCTSDGAACASFHHFSSGPFGDCSSDAFYAERSETVRARGGDSDASVSMDAWCLSQPGRGHSSAMNQTILVHHAGESYEAFVWWESESGDCVHEWFVSSPFVSTNDRVTCVAGSPGEKYPIALLNKVDALP